ncbi:hypothetical protein MKW98_024576 [Papaver atlanticum]|uniref:Peptidase A1 domain-containing protein n=1 Tax=Papaver atlanticum TaxID=357466 RepID=A0AAD4S835_9MAGN|nr:hypothetical protein MKW98_024576 [Papaver atlanticum]
MASSFSCCSSKYLFTLFLVFSMCFQNAKNCNAFQTFDFEIHHRFSDQVKAIMGADNLPEIGSLEYYAAMAHRDKVFHGRALSENDDDSKLLTLSHGADASYIDSLGPLHYANISLGTPSLSFFVALDTGTKLLWVPCIHNDMKREEISLNTYSVSSSSTSKVVTCNSRLCERECSKSSRECSYKVEYNANISSFGVLVEDVLRLKTDNHKPKDIDARIAFGCGQVQTGFYWDGWARNGLFGLGIGSTSVPSILSREGLVADSFSMCFGNDRVGRISFGDKGSSDQQQTPFNPMQQSPRYKIRVTQLSVGGNLSNKLNVTAIFYSGTELTQLSDPAYTALCDSFNSQIDNQYSADPKIDFEYCYDVSVISTDIPNVTFIMNGGGHFNVYYPMVPISTDGTVTAYCLGVMKSSGGNFIGNNFMIGHNIVFDREKMVLGWKASNCTDGIVDSRNDKFPPIPAASPAPTPTTNVQPPAVNDGAASPPITNVQPPSVNDGAASPPPPTMNVQPPSINGGTPRNSSNSNKAPQFSVGKPRNLYLVAWSLLVLFFPILQIL